MLKHTWLLTTYILCWCTLAILSVLDYSRIAARQCYFQTSWLFCDSALSTGVKIGILLGVTLGTIVFVRVGKLLWNIWTGHKNFTVTHAGLWAGALVVLALLVVPFGSSDTSYYFHAGQALAQGNNIFVLPWSMEKEFVFPIPHDTITSFSYGPIMARYFAALYQLSRGDIATFIILWKCTLLVVFILLAYACHELITKLGGGVDKKVFYFFWFTQPLVLFEVLVNGHFDIAWLLFVLLAILASLRGRWWLVVPLIAIGIWIKFIPLLFAPFFALWWWNDTTKQTWKKNTLSLMVGLVAACIVTLLSWGVLWAGPQVFASVVIQSKWAVISWFAVLYYSLKPLAVALVGGNAHFWLTRFVQASLLLLMVWFVWPYIKKTWRLVFKKEFWQPIEFVLCMFVCMLCYLFIWQKSLWPWYMVWLIPIGLVVVSVTNNAWAKNIARWMSLAPLAFYSIWLANWWLRRADGGSELWFYYVMVGCTTVYPLYQLWQWRKTNFQLTYPHE